MAHTCFLPLVCGGGGHDSGEVGVAFVAWEFARRCEDRVVSEWRGTERQESSELVSEKLQINPIKAVKYGHYFDE